MSIWRANGISGSGLALGAGAVVVLLAGSYFIVSQRPATEAVPTPAAAVTTTTPTEAEESTAATETPVAEPEAAPAQSAEIETTEPEVAEVVEPEVEVATPTAPSFDLVRVDENGATVVAGKAAPGETVRLMMDGELVAETVADASGSFVALLDLPPSGDARALGVVSIQDDGTELAGDETVLIAPVVVAVAEAPEVEEPEVGVTQADEAGEGEQPAVEVASTETEPSTSTEEVVETGTTEVAEAPEEPEVVAEEVAEVAPETPSVVIASTDGVRVVQPAEQPAGPGPEVTSNVVIDTITYDTTGEVALAGRGIGESFVRVYLNERPIRTTSIGADGNWRAELPEVDAGVYRLRVDEVDAEGEVTSRVETPFKREEPDVVEGTVKAVTVQPGSTLWAIAKERFGDGVQYVRVFEANRDLIRDPDLIYPGQVFAIPE